MPEGAVRLGPLMALPEVLSDLGADPVSLLAQVGLSPEYFADPEHTIAFAACGRLFRSAVEATGCGHVGLLVGKRATLSSLGAVGFLMKASPTVGHALRSLVRHLGVQDRGAVVTLDVGPRLTALGYKVLAPGIEAADQIYALSLMVGRNLLHEMCGNEWRAEEIRFTFAPRAVNAFRHAFEAPIRFHSESCAIVFQSSWLAHPLATADPLLHRMMADRIRAIEAQAPVSFVDRARQVLAPMVLMPGCSAALLAERLGLGRRTLFRRLAEEGVSFQSLRDEACHNTACELLASDSRRAADVAAILGYADASAFTRAFHRWSGATPAQWRATRRHAAVADQA